jgi:hypothetical protein
MKIPTSTEEKKNWDSNGNIPKIQTCIITLGIETFQEFQMLKHMFEC